MSCQFDKNRKCFTFLWILENFEFCTQKTGESLRSPKFIVDTICRTKWSLLIFPRGEESEIWIDLHLQREVDSKGPLNLEVDFELSLLTSDGSVMVSHSESKHAFSKGHIYGFNKIAKREFIFAKRSKFLLEGTLKIRCRIWNTLGEIKRGVQCISRTRISVEKKFFYWEIQNFSTFNVGRELIFRLKSVSDNKLIMTLNLCLNENEWSSAKNIQIKFVNSNKSTLFSTFKSSLIDVHGDYVECGKHDYLFLPTIQSDQCMLSFSKDALMDKKCQYLPNDVLTLYCEQALSTGVLLETIESTSYHCSGSMTNDVEAVCRNTSMIKESHLEISQLKTDISSMLEDNILCDVKLCTKSETFPAHWFILSARSPVFRAMFKSDMKEKAKDRIDIEDSSPDTVGRMLLYMYTDSLEDLQWESASDLYVVAEKYQIMALKEKCSAFLKSNLSSTNACEILLVADLHQDKELKSTVQNFILENDLIGSDEWKSLMETNLPLAAETMMLGYKK